MPAALITCAFALMPCASAFAQLQIFRGSTDDGGRVVVRVSGGHIGVNLKTRVRCTNGGWINGGVIAAKRRSRWPLIRQDGTFLYTEAGRYLFKYGSPSARRRVYRYSIVMSGRVDGEEITGSYRQSQRARGAPISCSANVSWRATRVT